MIKMKLKSLGKTITTMGQVKWIKGIFKDMFFKSGIKYVNDPCLQLEDYISRGVDIRYSSDDK
jgi:hypothetical protein